MESYEKIAQHAATLKNRFTGSLVAFAACAAVSFFVPAGASFDDPIVFVQLGLLFVALGVLPRSTAPAYWPQAASKDEEDRLDVLRTELREMQMRFTKVRVVYFLLIVPLLLLPSFRG